MGWVKKIVVLVVGLALLGSGLWLLGIVCLGCLALTFSSRKKEEPRRAPNSNRRIQFRHILAAAFAFLSLVALALGGVVSPVFFGVLAALAFFWPRLPFGPLGSTLTPVPGTILLRSSLVPLVWHSLAEVKPGAEDFARALSSYEGRLLIMKHGLAYAHAKAIALGSKTAEAKITGEFRKKVASLAPGGAYLLPLDADSSSRALMIRTQRAEVIQGELAGPPPDMLVLEASGGLVARSGSYAFLPGTSATAMLPEGTSALTGPPLLWEALDGLGRRLRWPDPDSFSNLLQALHASRNEPLSERLANLESSGDKVKVKSLSGDEVELSRAQLRAIISIYG